MDGLIRERLYQTTRGIGIDCGVVGVSQPGAIAARAPLLRERFAWVYVECSFMELYAGQSFADEVIAWLRERGLRLVGAYHLAYDGDGRAVQADFLWPAIPGGHPSGLRCATSKIAPCNFLFGR